MSLVSLPPLNLHTATHTEITAYFDNSFELYESLFTLLKDEEAFYQRSNPLRHPLIFYYGHTAVFYINKLYLAGLIPQRLNPDFESMFAIGVDEMSWDDLNEAHYDWPNIATVRKYRQQVRQQVHTVIDQLELIHPIDWSSPAWPVIMGAEHERIHLETSSVLIRQLPLQFVQPQSDWPHCPLSDSNSAPQNALITVPGEKVTLGKTKGHHLYGWDNEYGHHSETVESFAASQYLVSNQEFYQFVCDGAYSQAEYWSSEGWRWRQFAKATMPSFWRQTGDELSLRTLSEEIAMPWNWPAEVNFHEAKAFCNWKAAKTGKAITLPTESQWQLLRDQLSGDIDTWLAEHNETLLGNLNLQHYASAAPVNQHGCGEFYDVVGNVWQWTESTINGFSGFEPHPLYDDFSIPTFDGRHYLIKGGSFISTGNEATKQARYAFRPHFFQHAGFRYVESAQKMVTQNNTYETDALASQYLDFHYGSNALKVANFSRSLVDLCAALDVKPGRALDLGCSVGRASFELAPLFKEVVGIDFSARFIQIAHHLQQNGQICYQRTTEGELTESCQLELESVLQQPLSALSHVQFYQGDACNLSPKYGQFDLILAANLIDRLYEPRLFLDQVHRFVAPEGYLVIASPYTWLEEFTPKQHWLGGFKNAQGDHQTTLMGLKDILQGQFVLVTEPKRCEFVIRETQNKYQHSFAEVTVWRRL